MSCRSWRASGSATCWSVPRTPEHGCCTGAQSRPQQTPPAQEGLAAMMKIDSTTVQLVLAIAEEGSISRAADRLQLAVAAASRRLSDLEQQLGARLFKRQPHGVRATEPGLKLLVHIRQIGNLVERLGADAQGLGPQLEATPAGPHCLG